MQVQLNPEDVQELTAGYVTPSLDEWAREGARRMLAARRA